MQHFYFDLKDGASVRRRSRFDCFDERQARHRADDLAKEAATEQPGLIGKTYISVVSEQGREVYRAQILKRAQISNTTT